jgi:hypothetical protein
MIFHWFAVSFFWRSRYSSIKTSTVLPEPSRWSTQGVSGFNTGATHRGYFGSLLSITDPSSRVRST